MEALNVPMADTPVRNLCSSYVNHLTCLGSLFVLPCFLLVELFRIVNAMVTPFLKTNKQTRYIHFYQKKEKKKGYIHLKEQSSCFSFEDISSQY